MNEDFTATFTQTIVRTDIGRRYCDVVLKGGITSGVVYPTAIARLARQYRFRNIGGTSAGAVAAAGAAAAEFRRATSEAGERPEAGFDKLAELPDYLARKPSDSAHSNLFHLFRPEPATRRHFAILGAALNRAGPARRIARCLVETLWQFKLAALIGLVPGAFVAWSSAAMSARGVVALVVSAAFAMAGSIAAAVAAAALSLWRALPAQDFGLSRAYDPAPPPKDPAPLVNWLYPFLQDIAGKPLGEPLTFGDLDRVTLDERVTGIGLSMMTTALSMGRPMTLPFRVGRFYFRKEEMARYFSPEVIDAMLAHPGRATDAARDAAMAASGFYRLPDRDSLPVIVATRMSLSFPFLISAIPLYRHAWEDERAAAEPRDPGQSARMRRVLFSDGGICSNFPLHMFDTILPAWPTFGFNLRDDLARDAPPGDRAYVPSPGKSLAPEHYAIGEREGAGGVAAFAIAIVKTMQNWRDNLQRAAPGFRDRVVTVRHQPDEGGLNLDMAAEALAAMAASGQLAAERLVEAFANPTSIADDHLTRHRWARLRSLLAVLQEALAEIHAGVTELDNHPTFPDLIDHAEAYVGRSYPMRKATRAQAQRLLDALSSLHDALAESGARFDEHAPRPEVAMRIQPRL